MPSNPAPRPAVVTPRTGNRLASGIPTGALTLRARALKVILRSPLSRGRTRKRHHSPPLRMNPAVAPHDSLDIGQPEVGEPGWTGARDTGRTTPNANRLRSDRGGVRI